MVLKRLIQTAKMSLTKWCNQRSLEWGLVEREEEREREPMEGGKGKAEDAEMPRTAGGPNEDGSICSSKYQLKTE